MYPESLKNLIESFKILPGIGEKTAERLALSLLDMEDDVLDLFSKSLKDVKTKIKRCSICNNLSEEDKCEICKNKDRNSKTICVVEEPKNVILFEKLNNPNVRCWGCFLLICLVGCVYFVLNFFSLFYC